MVTSGDYKKWIKAVTLEVERLGSPKIAEGLWSMKVWTIWPTQRHLDHTTPNGDSDASLSAMKDALQEAGALDNDMRIIEDSTCNLYIKDTRRIVCLLERIDRDPTKPCAECDRLLAELAVTRSGHAYRAQAAAQTLTAKGASGASKSPRKKTKASAGAKSK